MARDYAFEDSAFESMPLVDYNRCRSHHSGKTKDSTKNPILTSSAKDEQPCAIQIPYTPSSPHSRNSLSSSSPDEGEPTLNTSTASPDLTYWSHSVVATQGSLDEVDPLGGYHSASELDDVPLLELDHSGPHDEEALEELSHVVEFYQTRLRGGQPFEEDRKEPPTMLDLKKDGDNEGWESGSDSVFTPETLYGRDSFQDDNLEDLPQTESWASSLIQQKTFAEDILNSDIKANKATDTKPPAGGKPRKTDDKLFWSNNPYRRRASRRCSATSTLQQISEIQTDQADHSVTSNLISLESVRRCSMEQERMNSLPKGDALARRLSADRRELLGLDLSEDETGSGYDSSPSPDRDLLKEFNLRRFGNKGNVLHLSW